MNITPASVDAIIELLEVKFPNKIPATPISLESFLTKVGNQQVIEYLKELSESL